MDLNKLSPQEREKFVAVLQEMEQRKLYNYRDTIFPDTGPLCRANYPKHIEFLNMGKKFRRRALFGGNRSGKTYDIGYEWACHIEGEYPDWWQGARFDEPGEWWVISKDNKQMVDAAQRVMLGRVGMYGTGMLRGSKIEQGKIYTNTGIPGGISRVLIPYRDSKHEFSTLSFKSCKQEMDAFMGAEINGAWFDEEPKADILGEVQMRLLTTNGLEVHTFTPLDGFTEVVKGFLVDGRFPTLEECEKKRVYVTNVEWDDAPHISAEQKEEFLAGVPAYLKESRSKGIPTVGEGRIYDIPENDFVVSPFEIPDHWPRCYAFDVGAKVNAAVWAAYDPQNDIWYVYDEYYAVGPNPDVHASAIKRKSKWFMPGIIDSAAKQGSQLMDTNLWEMYTELGLNAKMPDKSLEAGIMRTYDRLATGRLKVFRNCQNLLQEYRLYKYDSNNAGRPARHQADHALDALRYIVMTGEVWAEPEPDPFDEQYKGFDFDYYDDGRDSITGY